MHIGNRSEKLPTNSVTLLRRDNTTHTALRLGNIAFTSGYQMDVSVEDSLSCITADIDANIEARYRHILFHYVSALLRKEVVYRVEFRLPNIEIVGNVPLGDDQRMQRRNGKPVAYGVPSRCGLVERRGLAGERQAC